MPGGHGSVVKHQFLFGRWAQHMGMQTINLRFPYLFTHFIEQKTI